MHSICTTAHPQVIQTPFKSKLPSISTTRICLSSKHNKCPLQSYNNQTISYRKWRQPPIAIPHAFPEETTAAAVDLMTRPPPPTESSFLVKKKALDIYEALKGTSIFLVGMKSEVKASVGKVLSEALTYAYIDSDNVVEEATGEDPSGKSFRERDEAGFHEAETEIFKQLSSIGRLVVNAGNGAVQNRCNLALLRHGISVWIDVPLDMIAKDVTENGSSAVPNTSAADSFSKAVDHLTQLYTENKSGYLTADATVSVQRVVTKFCYDAYEQVTPEDIALEVLIEMEKLMREKKMMEEAGKPF